ncbi:MAG: hypothetical protein V4450_08860 [Bacteroidota bacterium]
MKKSTLIAGLAIVGCFAAFAAANLKLKQEYTKGNIQSAFTKSKLAPFRFIKVDFDSTSHFDGDFEITVRKSLQPGLSKYYEEEGKFVYTILNDTLVIQNDPLYKDHNIPMYTIKIDAPYLAGIDVTRGRYVINLADSDSLSIIAGRRSSVNLALNKINNLSITASDAYISINAVEPIEKAMIQLFGESSLNADNIIIKQKKLVLSKAASLRLSGRSMEDFGVVNAQK